MVGVKVLFSLIALFLITYSGATTNTEYDYIVIGAGTSGSIVASKLAKSGEFKVLLLEAGGDDSDLAVWNLKQYFNIAYNTFNYGFANWAYSTTPQPGAGDRQVFLPRGQLLGGTHSINGAAFVAGNPIDFDSIAEETGDRSFSWHSVKKYRKNLEKTLLLTHSGTNQQAAMEFISTAENVLGFQYNPNSNDGNQAGISSGVFTGSQGNGYGIRDTTFNAYVKPMMDKDNLDVVTFHRADQLIFDGNKVIGVTAKNMRASNPYSTITVDFFASKEVIVSAGTYASPKLLLQSGIGPNDELLALGITPVVDLPGVGKNLRDHYSVATFWGTTLPDASNFLFQEPTLNMFGPETSGDTNYQFELSGTFGSVVPLRAKSVGEVTLASADPDEQPLIDPKILSAPEDIETLYIGLTDYILPFFSSLIDQGIITQGNIDVNATEQEIRDFIIANVASSHHPVGTCKIGSSNDASAVVDNNFKVFGVQNLRVIDASVFPLAPSGNVNYPTMVISHLGASKVLGRHH